jgi:integrase
MSKKTFRVRPYAHGRLKFVVSSHLDGRRERKFFETRKEAETYAHLKEIELLNQGKEGTTFSTELRVLAQRADNLLRPFAKTVLDAAEFYVQHLRAISGSRKVSEVVSELLAARVADGLSADYLSDLKIKYGRFVMDFGDRMIASVGSREVSVWLRGLGVGAVSRNTTRSRLSTLFTFARRNGYTQVNPIADVERAKERGGEIGILTVAQTARLLESAAIDTLPYWAIGAFAGLRSAEIERLAWEEVDFEAGLIEIKASKAKTASRRLVTIQANLRSWLAPYRKHRGPLCPIGLRKKLAADRRTANLLETWPPNALRHSFGSYHLAHFKDAAALALQMGNSPAIIFQHYRELVKPQEAARFWRITPPATDGKVVAMVAA